MKTLEKAARLEQRHAFKLRDTINNFLKTHPAPLAEHVYCVEQQLNELKEVRKAFERIHEEFVDFCEPDIDKNETDTQKISEATKKVEDQCVDALTEVNSLEDARPHQSLVSVGSPACGNSTFVDTSTIIVSEHRLKPLEVPKFVGNPRRFIEFKELFENLIHNNGELANVQKMHRLKEALNGDAAETARAFRLQERAYPKAWAYLRLWYETNVTLSVRT